ncbi:Uncharacterized protein TPAR_07293 [Tolypocladium paradoxum]|uniref:Zn(2)-C6 fungal-type domain-containing protein n=1 Tax=Tolypocladium paradoxum TaxID=94208 RepID=A0A2S4KQR7_9HYPO|nr:Uncharacterized protein TPAR_07293 [Tolypocladium paradoxum]
MSSPGKSPSTTTRRRRIGNVDSHLLHGVKAKVIAGCRNCRTRRIKCDEKKPCGHCARKGLECKQTEFIVHERWPESTTATSTNTHDGLSEGQDTSTNYYDPESTYDVFRQASSTVPREPRRSPQLQGLIEVTVTEEIAKLLDIYQRGIGTWMDVLDHSLAYQRQVVRYALSSPLLLHAICALSAKQMSLLGEAFLWEPVSARHYGKSLGLLIRELTEQQTSREVIVSATILLCSCELLACPGVDYQRHLYGARSLFQTHSIAANGSSLEHAGFWIYARHDVSLALVHECATLIPPREWPNVPQFKETEEDRLGNRILWILAKMIEFRFSSIEGNWSDKRARDFRDLSSEIDLWWESLPSSARGIATTDISGNGLTKMWFCVPSAAAGCLYYHMTKILSFECLLERYTEVHSETSQYSNWLEEIRSHALAIASICLSPGLQEGALIVAVNPLFYAAKHICSLSLKTKIWALLEHIEVHLGFHTQNRVAQLQKELVLNNR